MDKFGYSMYLSERVEELIREGTLDEILKLIGDELNNEWKSTTPEDSKTRELIYHELHALNRLHLKLSAIISDLAMTRRESNG